jgi:hypothetical protein
MSALSHKRTFALQQTMSAFPSKADMCGALAHGCLGSKPVPCSGCEATLVSFCASPLRTPFELDRKSVSKGRLTLLHCQARRILLRRNPPLGACTSAPKELAFRVCSSAVGPVPPEREPTVERDRRIDVPNEYKGRRKYRSGRSRLSCSRLLIAATCSDHSSKSILCTHHGQDPIVAGNALQHRFSVMKCDVRNKRAL